MSVELPPSMNQFHNRENFNRLISRASYSLTQARFEGVPIAPNLEEIITRIASFSPNDSHLTRMTELLDQQGEDKIKAAVDFLFQSPKAKSDLKAIKRLSFCMQPGHRALPSAYRMLLPEKLFGPEIETERKDSTDSTSSPRLQERKSSVGTSSPRISSSSSSWDLMVSPRSRKRESQFLNCPPCLQTIDQGTKLAQEALFLKYLCPEEMKNLSKQMKKTKVKSSFDLLIEVYLQHQCHYPTDWMRAVKKVFEEKTEQEVREFCEVIDLLSAPSARVKSGISDLNFKQILTEYPFDTPANLQLLLYSATYSESNRLTCFKNLTHKDLRALRHLRISELLAKMLHWNSLHAFSLVVHRDEINGSDFRTLANKLGFDTTPNPLHWNIDASMKEFLSHPLFKHDECISYFIARIKTIYPSIEDPEIRQAADFFMSIEKLSAQNLTPLVECLDRVISKEGLQKLSCGNQNDGINFTNFKCRIGFFIPAAFASHLALESSPKFKILLREASSMKSEMIQDAALKAVVEELQKMNEILNPDHFEDLWQGLILIYFNNERLETLFGQETMKNCEELKRCLDLILLDSNRKEFLSHPLFKHEKCLSYFLERIKRLYPSAEDPEIKRAAEFFMQIEKWAADTSTPLVKSMERLISKEELLLFGNGNPNDAKNLANFKAKLSFFIPPSSIHHPALESSSAFKTLLREALSMKSETLQDPYLSLVVEELKQINGALDATHFEKLWQGLVLIHFNQEKMELLFGKDRIKNGEELKRCLDLILFDWNLKEFLSEPLFRQDEWITYLLERIKRLYPSVENLQIKQTADFFLLVEKWGSRNFPSLVESLEKVISKQGLRNLNFGNQNDGMNLTHFRSRLSFFMPPFDARHPALESPLKCKELIDKALLMKPETIEDVHLQTLVEEIQKEIHSLPPNHFDTLWQGWVLIHFNNEKLKIFFEKKGAKNPLPSSHRLDQSKEVKKNCRELNRCLDLILGRNKA